MEQLFEEHHGPVSKAYTFPMAPDASLPAGSSSSDLTITGIFTVADVCTFSGRSDKFVSLKALEFTGAEEIISEATNKAVNAFEVLLFKGSALPSKKTECWYQEGELSKKVDYILSVNVSI